MTRSIARDDFGSDQIAKIAAHKAKVTAIGTNSSGWSRSLSKGCGSQSVRNPLLARAIHQNTRRRRQVTDAMKVTIKEWNTVATWRWDLPEDDVCGICQVQFDGTCPTCKYPGDDCGLRKLTPYATSHALY